MALTLNTESKTYRELIGNGRFYTVPAYQRDYSWDISEWEELWYDIMHLADEEYHYMGYLVLQNTENKTFTIVDGQQRITTLSLLYLSGIKLLDDWIQEGIEPDITKERRNELERGFIGNKSAASINITPKLSLNRNNDDFYQQYILKFRKPINISRQKISNKRILRSYEFFFSKLKEKFSKEKNAEKLAIFLEESIAERLVFTVINVQDDLNAYKIFETLNARGIKLSTSDLLKNYLFSIAFKTSDIDLKSAESQWQSISETLGSDDFSTFLRHFWNSRYSLERKQTLFKAIKREYKRPEQVATLLDDLQEAVEIYSSLSNSAAEIWDRSRDNNQSKHIADLQLFNVTQCYPLLLAGYKHLQSIQFTKLLQAISIISFRYNIISNLNPNELENIFNEVANKISNKEIKTAKDAIHKLKVVYVDDERFKNNFKAKSMPYSGRNKKIIRYILTSLENQLSFTDIAYEESKITIEHILPENPAEGWSDYFKPEEQDIYCEYLGNYTLLEESLNNEIGSTLFEYKKPIYHNSQYKITKEYIDYTEWTPETLRKRQEKMAKTAITVWKINF